MADKIRQLANESTLAEKNTRTLIVNSNLQVKQGTQIADFTPNLGRMRLLTGSSLSIIHSSVLRSGHPEVLPNVFA